MRRLSGTALLVATGLLVALLLTAPGALAGSGDAGSAGGSDAARSSGAWREPGARSARVGNDPFVPSSGYHGDFPDPWVLRSGGTYYAYSTTIDSLNLPVMTSRDLVHWVVRGEGLRDVASWAQWHQTPHGRVATTWAPTVARFGPRWVHAYATPVRRRGARKMCLSTSSSTARSPLRGFVDRRTTPLVCPRDRGAIDPAYFTDVSGAHYLLWKREQTSTSPSQLFVSRLSASGLRVVGTPHFLLAPTEAWESPLIENPAMIRYRRQYYLFYSGGSYADSSYATGYARCASVVGPCTRVGHSPLLATGGRVAGTGGAMAFVDREGLLRLAYAAWDRGNTGYATSTSCRRSPAGCPQRRMHIATLAVDADGNLAVAARG